MIAFLSILAILSNVQEDQVIASGGGLESPLPGQLREQMVNQAGHGESLCLSKPE